MRLAVASLGAIVLLNTSAVSAQLSTHEPASATSSSSTAQVIYKGVVGNLLEEIPLDSQDRVQLQRLNAVVGSPMSGHSLAVALGIASPPLVVVGLIWGLWAAKQIQPRDAVPGRGLAAQQNSIQGEPSEDAPYSRQHHHNTATLHVPRASASEVGIPVADELVTDQHNPIDRLDLALAGMRSIDMATLSTVMGGAASIDRPVPCDGCYMPMIYPRATSDLR